jgi:DNA-binding NtrC family response regulator
MAEMRSIVVLLCDDDPNPDSGNAAHRQVIERCFSSKVQGQNIDFHILSCMHPDEIAKQLESPEAADGVDLALVDAYYGRWIPSGAFKEVTSEQDLSQSIVDRYGRDPRIKRLIVLTALPRASESEERLIDANAYEYWRKADFQRYDSFKRRLEELLDLPSRYDLEVFSSAFRRGIYSDKKYDFEAAKDEVNSILVGNGLEMRRIKRLIFEASQFDDDVPVLITGETGTGKELVAKLIHRLSKRGRVAHRDEPVTINCGLFSDDNLLRAELFGTHRGAFTGAVEREGILEAHKGTTLFLDEVGNSTTQFQRSLLRAIENREGARLGSSRSNEYRIDLRFVAATDSDLNDDKFSRPFVNRIRGLHIHIPPLRSRREDIPLLAEHFLRGPVDSSPLKLTLAARRALMSYDWPGNVRQLRHVLEIVSHRARQFSSLADRRGTTNWIYRDDIETLFSAPTLSATETLPVDASVMIADAPSYAEACDRFAGYYVRLRHEQVGRGERTNAAYDKTAAALGVSRSTVKKWLQPADEANDPGSSTS